MSTRTKPTLSAKDRAYLIAAGGREEPIGGGSTSNWWLDPRKDAAYHKRNGGSSWDYALRQQREYERFDQGLPIYAVCPTRDRYGYLLRKCTGADKTWTTITRYHDNDYLLQSIAEIEERALGMKDCAEVLAAWERRMARLSDDHHYPYILAFEEKHGTFHYDASTRDLFHKACLAVVKRRNDDGCWYDYEEAEELTPPALTEEQVVALKDGRIKDTATEEWKRYRADLKRLDGEKAERGLLAKALKGDGEAAADFLRARKDAEYEGMELIELDSLEDQ